DILNPGGAAEHGLQVRERRQGVEVWMHERQIVDLRDAHRIGPEAELDLRQSRGEGLAPGVPTADAVKTDDQQRHDASRSKKSPRPRRRASGAGADATIATPSAQRSLVPPRQL